MQGREALAPGPPEVTGFLRGGLLGIQVAASLRASRKLRRQEGAREPGFNILRIVTDRLDNLNPRSAIASTRCSISRSWLTRTTTSRSSGFWAGTLRDNATLLQCNSLVTTTSFRFRALLTDGKQEVRVKKVAGNYTFAR